MRQKRFLVKRMIIKIEREESDGEKVRDSSWNRSFHLFGVTRQLDIICFLWIEFARFTI